MKNIKKVMILTSIFLTPIAQGAESLKNQPVQNFVQELKTFLLNCDNMAYEDAVNSWNRLYQENSNLTFGQFCDAYKTLEEDPVFMSTQEDAMQKFLKSAENDIVPNSIVISHMIELQ